MKLGSHYGNENKCIYINHLSDFKQSRGRYTHKIDYKDVPMKGPGVVRLVTISDTHGRHAVMPPLPEGDIMVHCGDVFMTNSMYSKAESVKRLHEFNSWLGRDDVVRCPHKIVIGGNHDFILDELGEVEAASILSNCTYCLNTAISVCGLSFYCCPLSRGKSHNKAFQGSDFRDTSLARALAQRESGMRVDVLVTHGSNEQLQSIIQPQSVHLFGHYHAMYGATFLPRGRDNDGDSNLATERPLLSCCSSIMDRHYQLTNVPIVIDIPLPAPSSGNVTV
jgi:hypothetical protein